MSTSQKPCISYLLNAKADVAAHTLIFGTYLKWGWVACASGVLTLSSSNFCAAQNAPWPIFAPSFPTSPGECQAFGAEIAKYTREAERAHNACLENHKADRPNERPDSRLCSRAPCQTLHDILFGNPLIQLSTGELNKQLAACNEQVQVHLAAEERNRARKVRDQQEVAAHDAADNQRRADHLREQEKVEWEERDRSARLKARRQQGSAQPATESVVTPSSLPARVPTPPATVAVRETKDQYDARMAARLRDEKARSDEVLLAMVDPFGKSQSQPRSGNDDSKQVAGLIDPFSTNEPTSAISAGVKVGALNIENEVVETSIKSARETIVDEVRNARMALTPSQFKTFEQEAKKDSAYVEGLGHLLEVFKYGTSAGLILAAKTQTEKGEAGGDVVIDTLKGGFVSVAKRLNPSYGKFLEGPVGWALGFTLDSTVIGVEPQEILYDNSGRYDLNEKKTALDTLISTYNVNRANHTWSYYQWLEQTSNRLYNASSGSTV
jgi:hypothetical protein